MLTIRPRPEAPPATARKWLALVVVATAQLVVALDATIVNVALPTAQRALGFDDGDRAWVVTAYTLSFAGLLLVGGRVADRLGQRRALLTALVGFAAASAIAGAATGFGTLVAGRALQGAFAAVLAPTALSMIAVTFTDPRERGKAFGVFGAVASSGAVVGLLLGGVLTETLGWRWCLYVNLVVCLSAVAAGRVLLPRRPGDGSRRLDVMSGGLATAGLAGVVLGCSQAAEHGWTSVRVTVPLLAGAALGAGFLLRQHTAQSPLLPLGILRDRIRIGAYLATAAGIMGMFGMFLMLTYYYQVVLGYSAMRTGLAFLPMTLAVAASAYGLASRLMSRVQPLVLVVPGLLVSAAGLWLLTTLGPAGDYLTVILPAEVLAGAGIGCVVTPAIAAATARIDPRQAGVTAAVANVAMQIGGSVGTAVLNTIAIDATRDFAGGGVSALVHGYTTATAWSAGLLLTAAATVTALVATASKRARS